MQDQVTRVCASPSHGFPVQGPPSCRRLGHFGFAGYRLRRGRSLNCALPSNREGSGQTTEYRSWIPLRIDRKVNAAPFQCMDLFSHDVLYGHHRTQLSVADHGDVVQRQPKMVIIARESNYGHDLVCAIKGSLYEADDVAVFDIQKT